MSSPLSPITSSAPPAPYKILVAVAFDATGDSALREGMSLAAARRGSELHVVHVVTDLGMLGSEDALLGMEQGLEQAPGALRKRIEALWQEEGAIEVTGHIRPGYPGDTILRVAAEIDADLLVLGTHHRGGIQKLLVGSVGGYVLARAHCPVLIAMPKDTITRNERIEPPCPDCLQIRAESANQKMWCERHSKPSMRPHVYVPHDSQRDSMMPTY